MDNQLLNKLHTDGILSDLSFSNIKLSDDTKILSVYWELKTMLYAGVLLFTSGASILIYKNINTIGHTFILLFIALVSAGSFMFCFKKSPGFSSHKVIGTNAYLDYILLLACVTFTILIAYLQFQYHFFGIKYGLALFIPMLLLFTVAYYFDNLAILSLAITNLGAWAGVSVTPLQFLHSNNFDSNTIIYTGLGLGILLVLLGFLSAKKECKAHFEFTYSNFGAHLLFISCLAALFIFGGFKYLWMLALLLISYFFYKKALVQKSFYFLLIMTLYLYIGLSYIIFQLLFSGNAFDVNILSLSFIYFIISAIGLFIFLTKMNKKIQTA